MGLVPSLALTVCVTRRFVSHGIAVESAPVVLFRDIPGCLQFLVESDAQGLVIAELVGQILDTVSVGHAVTAIRTMSWRSRHLWPQPQASMRSSEPLASSSLSQSVMLGWSHQAIRAMSPSPRIQKCRGIAQRMNVREFRCCRLHLWFR